MKKRNNLFKIFMIVIMIVAMFPINTAKAGTTELLSENDSIAITFWYSNTLDTPPTITKELFDLSTTNWYYVYYDNDEATGTTVTMGVIDNSFTGITFKRDSDKLVCSPISGSANFYGEDLIEEISAELYYEVPAVVYCELNYYEEYTIENNEEWIVYLIPDGNYLVDYSILDSDDIPYESQTGVALPEQIIPNDKITITVSNRDSYNINNPVVGGFYYTTGNINNVFTTVDILEEYTEYKTNTYNMDGATYTLTNKGKSEVEVTTGATAAFQATVYDASGTAVGSANGSGVAGRDITSNVPAGGKIVYTYTKTDGATLTIKYYKLYDSVISIEGVRKAAASETKKVYIHFPEGSLVPSGLSKDSTGYYVSVKVNYVDTTLSQTEDTVGGFSISAITDTSGLSSVNKWYVYNTSTGKPYTASAISGSTLSVVPLQSDFYTQLLSSYGGKTAYHIYAEWEVPSITKSGTYNLVKGIEYKLGSGKWTTNGDSSIYNGGMSFYVDSTGSYTLTLQ